MNDHILLVDDDERLLSSFQRQLGKSFSITLACGAQRALDILSEHDPFAVVVSDMRMPGMSGIDFLANVREQSPHSVRMMLTAYADLDVAISAINEGWIFRFLTKPCPLDTLAGALRAGIEQHRLITSERELLHKTLKGSIAALVEVLSLVSPAAFGRAMRLKRYVSHVVQELQPPDHWSFELAALLSQIGCVTLPTSLLEAVGSGRELSSQEQTMFDSHPQVGARIVSAIPRLEAVSQMIASQLTIAGAKTTPTGDENQDQNLILGSKILATSLALDLLITQGWSHRAAIEALRHQVPAPDRHILDALETLAHDQDAGLVECLKLQDLTPGMTAQEDVRPTNGLLLLESGQEITETVLDRLHNFAQGVGVVQPIRVRIEDDSTGMKAS